MDEVIQRTTYAEIAKASGVDPRHVSRVLRGKSNCTTSTIDKLARALEVESGQLLDYIQAQKQPP